MLPPRVFYFMNNVATGRGRSGPGPGARGPGTRPARNQRWTHAARGTLYVTATGSARINLDHGRYIAGSLLIGIPRERAGPLPSVNVHIIYCGTLTPILVVDDISILYIMP